MSITKDQFQQGYTYEEWLDVVRQKQDEWSTRHRDARLGELRAEYEHVDTPRYVACLVDDACTDSVGTVPYIAKACEQAGVQGGVELRILPKSEHPALLKEFTTDDRPQTPVCVVYDRDWVQLGRWGPRPRGARELSEERLGNVSRDRFESELDTWYRRDAGQSALREFLDVLRGPAVEPWRAGAKGERLRKQAQHSRR